MIATFADAVRRQADYMAHVARRLDERGYAVILHNATWEAENDALYRGFEPSLQGFLEAWSAKNRGIRRPVIVHIKPLDARVRPEGNVLSGDFPFWTKIATTKRFAPIVAAIELVSSTQKGRYCPTGVKGNGILHATRLNDYVEFSGRGRDALSILLKFLEMPQHRECLLQRRKVKADA